MKEYFGNECTVQLDIFSVGLWETNSRGQKALQWMSELLDTLAYPSGERMY